MHKGSVILGLTLLASIFTNNAIAQNGDHAAHESADHSHEDTTMVVTENQHVEHAEEAHVEEEGFNPTKVILHHISDSHEWHLWDSKDEHGHVHSVSVPLPVILYTENGVVSFMSSEFHHDDHGTQVVEAGGQRFVKNHDKIYYASETANEHGQFLEMHEEHAVNAMPMDFSITKNTAGMMVAALVVLLVFMSTARFYKKNGAVAPKGLAGFMEPLIIFVRDDIAKDNIGEKHYKRFTPYLLTLFFFIWVNNLLGLIPIIPGGANVTGNIAVTLTLAAFTLIIVNVNANKDYWKHIFWMPGVPVPVKILLAPIELVSVFTKPFALMVRLFANITAGHIVVLSLVSLIFIFQTVWISPASVLLTLFISVLELLVAALQAYIFTMLTALFLGMAMEEHAHDEHH